MLVLLLILVVFGIAPVPVSAGIYFGGQEYDTIYLGGNEFTALRLRGQTYHTADNLGTLSVTPTRRSRGVDVNYSITDADGIRAVTAVIMLAGDGTRSDVTSEITRTNANTFSGVSNRANNKWRNANITITYTDATSGASHTLTQAWSV